MIYCQQRKEGNGMELPITFTLREVVRGVITLLMYEFIFRPLIFQNGVKGTKKEQQGEKEK